MSKYRLIGTEAGGFTCDPDSALAKALLESGYELLVEPVEVPEEPQKPVSLAKGKK